MGLMELVVTTASNGIIVAPVKDNAEAALVLRRLADSGVKCLKWEIRAV